jgi:hypothetical protein
VFAQAAMAFLACGSKEVIVFFVCFCGFAAKANELKRFFHPAGGEKARCGRSNMKNARNCGNAKEEIL